MNKTSIEWTDISANPIRARRKDNKQRVPGHFCQKISAGCANCYSSTFQPRFGLPMFPGTNKSPEDVGVEPYLDEEILARLLKVKKPYKVFLCDMTDLFGNWVPFEWIDKIFAVMAMTPNLTYQILTKRPERAAEYLNDPDRQCHIAIAMREAVIARRQARPTTTVDKEVARQCNDPIEIAGRDVKYRWWITDQSMDKSDPRWPLPNVWIGTSVEDQKAADSRIAHLLNFQAAVRFLSCEPLLGEIDLRLDHEVITDIMDLHPDRPSRLRGVYPFEMLRDEHRTKRKHCIHWVIGGGESGRSARPPHPAWARSLRDQCASANIPFFWKQWGEWIPKTQIADMTREGWKVREEWVPAVANNNKWGCLSRDGKFRPQTTTWNGRQEDEQDDYEVAMYGVGKKVAGRLLDGVEHNGFPGDQRRQQ